MNGMKKNRIFSIGALLVLTMVLTACGRSTSSGQFSNQEIRTSWVVGGDEYVVCENRDTEFEIRFDSPFAGRVHSADVVIAGENFGSQSFRLNRSDMTFNDPEHDVVFDLLLRTDADPYPMSTDGDLSTSSIVIVPVVPPGGGPPAIGGRQTLTAMVRDSDGWAIGIVRQSFNVWGACENRP